MYFHVNDYFNKVDDYNGTGASGGHTIYVQNKLDGMIVNSAVSIIRKQICAYIMKVPNELKDFLMNLFILE
jgi:hypothetical protein